MALAGVTSWDDLAERTPFSRSLLKDLGTERGRVEEQHLRPIAAACGVPYAWFTVPDLAQVVADSEDATLGERVEALERQSAATRQRLEAQLREINEQVVAMLEAAKPDPAERVLALAREAGQPRQPPPGRSPGEARNEDESGQGSGG